MADHVFISYSHEDQAYTRKLADNLHKSGYQVWMDDRVHYGERWWRHPPDLDTWERRVGGSNPTQNP